MILNATKTPVKPEGAAKGPPRKYSERELLLAAELSAEGCSLRNIAKGLGGTHWTLSKAMVRARKEGVL